MSLVEMAILISTALFYNVLTWSFQILKKKTWVTIKILEDVYGDINITAFSTY